MLEKIDVYPYRRAEQSDKKRSGCKPSRRRVMRRLIAGQALTREGLLLCLLGFFLGRAVLLGEMVPGAAAFVAAAARAFPGAGLFAVLGVGAGLVTVSRGLFLAGSVGAVVLTWFFVQALPPAVKRPWLVVPGVVLSLTVVVKTGLLVFTTPSTYQYITILFEAAFSAIFTLIFLQALPSLSKLTGVSSLAGEELFCMLVLLAAVVAGTGDLQVGIISLKGLLSRLIILLGAILGGAGMGAAVGAVVGIIPGLVYMVVPSMIGAYSFAGLLAGLCRNFGKPGVSLGFFLGNIILSVYLTNFGSLAAVMAETGVAVLLFLAIPGKYIGQLRKTLSPVVLRAQGAPPRTDRVQAMLAGRMRSWSRVFDELSRSFNQASTVTPGEREDPGLQPLFAEIGNKVCQGCSLYRTCWERDFYRTYQSLLDLFTLVEMYGQVTGQDLPENLKKRCFRPNELAITVTCLYETYKLNCYWVKRLAESREIVSGQLKGVAEIIENLSSELEFEVDSVTEDEMLLKQKLKQEGIPVVALHVLRNGDDRREILFTRPSCGQQLDCHTRLIPVASRLMGENFVLPFTKCLLSTHRELCTLRLYPGLKYRLGLGVAGVGKNGSTVSGDSYAFIQLREGKCALILSDGMGTGPQAALESGTAVSLLERLLESGLDRNLAVKTVNSIMVLRSSGDTFATLDMTVVDLYKGQAEFVKIGAPPTFLVRGRRISVIRTSSLPVGIIQDIDVASVARTLMEGDVLVMVSDGILDSNRGPGDKEDWVSNVLHDVRDFSPQEIAELLLKLARTGAGSEQIPDDMTVLVARVERA